MELKQYLFLLRRWAWLMVVGAALGAGGAYAASQSQAPLYQTSTKVMVMGSPEDRGADSYYVYNDIQLARTYSQLIVTEPVLQTVSQRLGFAVGGGQVSARQQPDSLIIVLTVSDGDPAKAALIANGIVQAFVDYNNTLQLSRFATSEESLKAQIGQVEAQIDRLQSEMSQLSEESLRAQQQQVAEQIARLEPQISGLRAEIAGLDEERQQAEVEEKRARLGDLEATQKLFQQLQFNLTVLGEATGSGKQNLGLSQLQTTLALYQQIYSNLLNNYENVRLARLRSTPNIVQIEQARLPGSPVQPRPLRSAALGGAAGLLIMALIAFLIEYLDDTLKTPDEVVQALGLPVLGVVARHPTGEGGPVALQQPRAPVAEAFRSLRTNLQFSSAGRPLRTVLVTSPSPADGKSTVAANLAVVLAQSGRRVALVDADLRRPRAHQLFGLHKGEGLSGLFLQMQVYLDGKLRLERSLQKTGLANLWLLASGSPPPNPAELLGSETMLAVLEAVKEQAQLVVIDSPPVLAVTDAAALAPGVDGVLLVIKPGATKLAACRQAVEQLRRVGANLLGVVLNDVQLKRSAYYHYQYSDYYYAYSETYAAAAPQNGNGYELAPGPNGQALGQGGGNGTSRAHGKERRAQEQPAD